MQPVSPYRARYGNTDAEDSSSPAQPNARSAPTPPPDPADLPDLRDPALALTTTQLLPQEAVDPIRTRVRDQATQQGLDDYQKSMTPTFETPEGAVSVRIPFQMTDPYRNQPSIAAVGAEPEMVAAVRQSGVAQGDLTRILSGRGTPQDIQRLTQALIDTSGLPCDPTLSPAERIRKVMFDHHIGIDCAGYVQGAYLSATGLTRAQAGFNSEPCNESLDTLRTNPRYRSIESGQVRPGDIGVLGPPSDRAAGHRVVVYDRHEASAKEMSDLLASGPGGARLAAYGSVSVFVVDSSWGCGITSQSEASPHADSQRSIAPQGDPQQGGVKRVTWYYNGQTGQWGNYGSNGFQITPKGPYDHPLVGFYRRRDSDSLDLPALKGAS
jgi:hypothetical protein